MTKIITTIGPSSNNLEILKFFREYSVDIARLNCSHNTPEWHLEAGNMCRQAKLKILMDLCGPKIRIGEFETVEVKNGQKLVLEMQDKEKAYPYEQNGELTLPLHFPIQDYIKAGERILVDDGKLEWVVEKVEDGRVYCEVLFGGLVKSRKGMNMPSTKIEVDFLTERDHQFLDSLVHTLRPEYIACSFVKTAEDVKKVKARVEEILTQNGISKEEYRPKICSKIEMKDAVSDANLGTIIAESDIIMIARGDLALETYPAHVLVPYIQQKIANECKFANKPFIVATQALETMMDAPVPTRAEISDIYRSIYVDRANYVMLSGESAGGKYPIRSVEIMHQMIQIYSK